MQRRVPTCLCEQSRVYRKTKPYPGVIFHNEGDGRKALLYWRCGQNYGIELHAPGHDPKRFLTWRDFSKHIRGELKKADAIEHKWSCVNPENQDIVQAIPSARKKLCPSITTFAYNRINEGFMRGENICPFCTPSKPNTSSLTVPSVPSVSSDHSLERGTAARVRAKRIRTEKREQNETRVKSHIDHRVIHEDGKIEEHGIEEHREERTLVESKRIEEIIDVELKEFTKASQEIKSVKGNPDKMYFVFKSDYLAMTNGRDALAKTYIEHSLGEIALGNLDPFWRFNLCSRLVYKLIADDPAKREYPELIDISEMRELDMSQFPDVHPMQAREWKCQFRIALPPGNDPQGKTHETFETFVSEVALRLHEPYERKLDAYIQVSFWPRHVAHREQKLGNIVPRIMLHEQEQAKWQSEHDTDLIADENMKTVHDNCISECSSAEPPEYGYNGEKAPAR